MRYSVHVKMDDRTNMTGVFASPKKAREAVKEIYDDSEMSDRLLFTEPDSEGVSLIVLEQPEGISLHIHGTITPTERADLFVIHEV